MTTDDITVAQIRKQWEESLKHNRDSGQYLSTFVDEFTQYLKPPVPTATDIAYQTLCKRFGADPYWIKHAEAVVGALRECGMLCEDS